MEQAFAKFEEGRGAVTPELLEGICKQVGIEAPSKETLEQFIESVYVERETPKESFDNRVVLIGEGHDGGKIRRSIFCPPDFVQHFDAETHPHLVNAKTLWEVFVSSTQTFPSNPLFGTTPAPGQPYNFQTYAEVAARVKNVSAGLLGLGIKPKQFLGVMLDTCPEWGIVENALWAQSMTVVILYPSYGIGSMQYIVNHTDLEHVVVGAKNLPLLQPLKETCPTLKTVIVVGTQSDIDSIPPVEGITFVLFSTLENNGKENPQPYHPPSGADLAMLIYTSGTTGNPKGVMHSHRALLINAAANIRNFRFYPTDIHIAFLPMAHIMEQFLESLLIASGASIGFYSGDIRVLMQNIASLRPTIFIAVPRLLNRLFATLRGGFNALEGPKKAAYELAFASKQKWLAKGCFKSFYDLFFFQKAAAALGGRVRMIAVGSAPIEPVMLEFFRIVFSCTVQEGYGMTEAIITHATFSSDTETKSHVGCPNTGCETKLLDVPELNYLTTNDPPRGEVCFRGPMNMMGYYKDPEKTAETIDSEGWLHSGDVGEWLPGGCLRVFDRIKHIFKLQQGEYVAPEKLEQLFAQSKYVAQIFINGSSFHAFLVAIVAPEPVAAEAARVSLGLKDTDELFASAEFKKLVREDILAVGKKAGVLPYEIPAAVSFSPAFDQLGLLTPTFKLKRNEARACFSDTINAMLDKLNDK